VAPPAVIEAAPGRERGSDGHSSQEA